MPKLDLAHIDIEQRTGYPEPFRAAVAGRFRQRLGDAGGLNDFGVNLMRLKPGAASSQRHWHSHEDEFVYVLDGTATLVTDAGATTLGPGDCACFPKGEPNGHHLLNRSDRDVLVLEVGSRIDGDGAQYPDIDLVWTGERYTRRDGSPY